MFEVIVLSCVCRQDYFDWTIQQWRGGVECGSDVSTGECTTVLLDVILNFDGSAQ